MIQTSSVECPCDEVGDHFSQKSLHVLLVDDDQPCQRQIQDVLKNCSYEVTICSNGKEALSLLQNKKSEFDIALVDVDMPAMEGLKLLECIALEMDIPAALISGNYTKEILVKGEAFGACDFYHKPLRIDAAKRLWHSILDKKFQKSERLGNVENRKKSEESCSKYNWGENMVRSRTMPGAAMPVLGHNLLGFYNPTWEILEMHKLMDPDWFDEATLMPVNPKEPAPEPSPKGVPDLEEENEIIHRRKKPRIAWTPALHRKFTLAVEHVGIDKATPKNVWEAMKEPNVTRASIASHLQKYREFLQQMSASKKSNTGKEEPVPKKVRPHPNHLKELRKQIAAQYLEFVPSEDIGPTTSGPPLLVADPSSQDDNDPTIQFMEVQQPQDPDKKNEPADPAPNPDWLSLSLKMQGDENVVMETARLQPKNPIPGLPPHWGKLKVPSGLSIKGCNLFLEEIDFPWETDLGFATKRIVEQARNLPALPLVRRRKSSVLGDGTGAPGSKEASPSK